MPQQENPASSQQPQTTQQLQQSNVADLDVLIVGAGVSGLATAHELRKRAPDLKVSVDISS